MLLVPLIAAKPLVGANSRTACCPAGEDPGRHEVKSYHKQLREIAQSHGARQIAGFEIALGQPPGSLIYIVAYEDADAYVASTKALAESAAWQKTVALVASSESAVLAPLPDSQIQ